MIGRLIKRLGACCSTTAAELENTTGSGGRNCAKFRQNNILVTLGLVGFAVCPHGLRRGLHSCAASRLRAVTLIPPCVEVRVPAQTQALRNPQDLTGRAYVGRVRFQHRTKGGGFAPRSGEADRQITLGRDRGHSQDSGMVGGWVHSAIKAFLPLHERCWEVRRICSLVVW